MEVNNSSMIFAQKFQEICLAVPPGNPLVRHGWQKTKDLPIMVEVGAVGRYGESRPPPRYQATETIEEWPPWFDPSTEPSKDWPPRLDPSTEPIEECPPFQEQHVQVDTNR
jgi:hypothetical protein